MAEKKFCWTIEDYSKLNKEKGVSVKSPIFDDARGTLHIDWQLVFYPGGAGKMSSKENSFDYDEDNDDHVSLYLKMVRCNYTSVAAKFKIQLRGKVGEISSLHCGQETQFSVMHNNTWGWRHATSSSTTRNFIRHVMEGDKVEVHCEIYFLEIMGEQLDLFKSADTACTCTHQYWSFYEQQKFTDFVIGVGTKEFRVHKLVLANRSPVFEAMFNHVMEETVLNRLEISDFDADTVKKFIQFMYTGHCEDPEDKVAELLACAEKYDLQELKAICEVALARDLDAQNAVTVLQVADVHRAHHLKKLALKFIKDNIEKVITSPGWKSLSCPSLVDDFIKFSFAEKFGNLSSS